MFITHTQTLTHDAAKDSPKILIVDDSPEQRELLKVQLRNTPFRVFSAETGAQGIELARQQQPDLVLLDVLMPGMSGFEVCRRLKNDPQTVGIAVIIITSLSDVAHRLEGIKAGADDFIVRPHHIEELLIRINSLLKLKQAREKLESGHKMLQLLYNVSQAIASQTDLKQMMIDIIVTTKTALNATTGNIILLNEQAEVTHKILVRDDHSGKISSQVSHEVMSHGLAGWLIKHREAIIIEDAAVDARWLTLTDDKDVVGSVIGIPLQTPLHLAGLLILTHPQAHFFTAEHLELTVAVARQVTSAIQNAYLFVQVDEERRKLETILAQSNDAIITVDESGRITLLNHAAERLFDVSRSEIFGRNIHTIPALNKVAHLFVRAEINANSDEIILDDSTTLFGTVAPIHNVGYMAVMQDITALKQAEAQRLATERLEKDRVTSALNRYISPALLEDVLTERDNVFTRRARRFAVVLFADLRNSTELVVKLPPDQAVDLLNEFFDTMTAVIYEFDGTIFDLIGDELEIGFNVPLAQPDAVQRAFKTAVAMQQRFQELVGDWYERSGVLLGLGIGIEIGDVVLGNVGAKSRMHYAMVGRAVNVAHSMVDLAKDGQIVVSEQFYQALQEQDELLFQSTGSVTLEHHQLKGMHKVCNVIRFEQPVEEVVMSVNVTEDAFVVSHYDAGTASE